MNHFAFMGKLYDKKRFDTDDGMSIVFAKMKREKPFIDKDGKQSVARTTINVKFRDKLAHKALNINENDLCCFQGYFRNKKDKNDNWTYEFTALSLDNIPKDHPQKANEGYPQGEEGYPQGEEGYPF